LTVEFLAQIFKDTPGSRFIYRREYRIRDLDTGEEVDPTSYSRTINSRLFFQMSIIVPPKVDHDPRRCPLCFNRTETTQDNRTEW
jgi:hypothetical protein